MTSRLTRTPVPAVGSRRNAGGSSYTPPVADGPRRGASALRGLVVLLSLLCWAAGTAASATAVIAVAEPVRVSRYGAALLTLTFTVVLAHRCGARVRVWGPLVAAGIAVTAVVGVSALYSAMSVVAAVVSAVLAVMITRPAATLLRLLGEYLLAVLVATSGALAVAAWNAPVIYERYHLVVLALALLLTLSVVWGLGAGLHGLGRRGFLLVIGAAVLLALILAYGTAVRAYGSQTVVVALDQAVFWLRDHVGGVPRPAQVLVGLPALVWGIGIRSRRRQGWWMCSFGVVATASITTSLASPQALPGYIGLSTLYSVVLGLLVGLVVRALDPGTPTGGGRGARRAESEATTRPEAARTESLT